MGIMLWWKYVSTICDFGESAKVIGNLKNEQIKSKVGQRPDFVLFNVSEATI